MKLSEINPLPNYFGAYMTLSDDCSHLEAFQIAKKELETLPLRRWNELGDRVYEPGKWTIKSILQHVIDTERVFLYRALSYARGEKNKVLGFDENAYAEQADVSNRTLEDLLEELAHVHESAIYLFRSFGENVLHNKCQGFAGEYIVGAVPFILLGHQRRHFKVIEERYLPLLKG